MNSLHSELRKVNESEVEFATPVRRMVNHSCVERDFIVVVLFLLFFIFFRFICQVVYLGQKSREKKRRRHGRNFNPSSREICQM